MDSSDDAAGRCTTRESTFSLLQELLWAYGPGGREDDVRSICIRELGPLVDQTWVDDAGNVVGVVRGESTSRKMQPIRVMAHMDELSMLVKRVESDGTLHLSPLGTMYPGNFGLGPVAILGRNETLCGVLTLGSEHTTRESQRIWETKPDQGDRSLDWSHVYVFTGRTGDELTKAGITPGTRICIDRTKRSIVEIGEYVGSYFMDDRAAIVVLLEAARRLRASTEHLPQDVYLVFTTNEEIGGVGAAYAHRQLPEGITLAVEVGPTEREYDTSVSGGPIVAYSDAQCVYDTAVADQLMDLATELGAHPQAAVLGAFESDASHGKAAGLAPRAGLLCIPTLSTHGYEVIARDALETTVEVLLAFLRQPSMRLSHAGGG
ncbi:M20/M25/M40 family metallo-hydrolase [Mycolicibacterium sp. BK634]|uniref:M42 family metallopeptidase n=1 Tax=Mycolicibacterium sp. BK634 TaxID=2587099 RepID=UPI0016073575